MKTCALFHSPCRIVRGILLAMTFAFLLGQGAISASAGTIYYVGNGGDDSHSGLSEEAAFATLAHAVEMANADPAAEAVVVLSDFELTAPIELTGAYTLRGKTTDPTDTLIAAAKKTAVTPLVKVSNPAAVVAHLTLSGGTATGTSGGDLWLNGGGVVTNCLIRNATGGDRGKGAGIRNDNGIVTHCVIEDAHVGNCYGLGVYQTGERAVTEHSMIRGNRMDAFYGGGGGIQTIGGVVRYCVISNNVTRSEAGHGGSGGGIHSTGATIHHCLVACNRGGGSGGGIYCEGNGNVISNCTVVGNTARDGGSGISSGYNDGVTIEDVIILGNTCTLQGHIDSPGEDYSTGRATTWSNTLAVYPIGKSPVVGDPAFVDFQNGDYRLTARSAAIGAGKNGGDLGYMPFDASAFSVGLSSAPTKALPAGKVLFTARARNNDGEVLYRWRLDDLNVSGEGAWTDFAASSTNEPDLSPGHWKIVVEARDGSGATSRFSRSFYIGAKRVYLVPAGTEGNTPVPPYDTPATAANDIQEAILYCTDGSELVASDGDYGVTREVYVPAKVLIRSLNGPEKTSIYRVGAYGEGVQARVVHLRGKGAVLSGFAVTNGYMKFPYDMKYGCNVFLHEDDVVTNCIISHAKYGETAAIASVNGKILGTIVRQNYGGGALGGAVSLWGKKTLMADCVVSNHHNSISGIRGLGICANSGAVIRRCIVRDNRNKDGVCGGVYLTKSDLYDSVVCDNASSEAGGVLTRCVYSSDKVNVVNCTIANNTSFGQGGGLQVGPGGIVTIVNTLLHGNVAGRPSGSPGEPNWSGLENSGCSVSHIAVPNPEAAIGTLPLVLTNGPSFVDPEHGDYSLLLNSPCRNAGDNGDRTPDEADVARRPRIAEDVIDIGAHEYQLAHDLSCAFQASGYDTVPGTVTLESTVDGTDQEGLQYRWGIRLASTGADYTWTPWDDSETGIFTLEPGRYLFALEVRNSSGEQASFSDGVVRTVVSEKVFLVPPEAALGEPVFPYDSWEHAATNIPMALSAAGNGTTVLATNGAYGVTSSAVIDKAVRFESVEGPDVTSVYRAFPRRTTRPAFRPVTLTGPGAFFGGFTVSNSIGAETFHNGAVILCQDSTVSNCVFCDNILKPDYYGAIVGNVDGLVTHCVLRDNTGGGGSGLTVRQTGADARFEHCEIYRNKAISYYGTQSVLLNDGIFSDCVITGNLTATPAGYSSEIEQHGGLVYNCLVAWNNEGVGGGAVRVFNGALVNCTVVSNYMSGTKTPLAGGVVFAGGKSSRTGVTNCIVYGNFNAQSDGTIGNGMESAKTADANVKLSHTLLENWREIDPGGVACQTGNPLFVDFDGRDWHLGKGSPCRDAGVMHDFMRGGTDLDGRPRVVHRDRVDLGCYEADYIVPYTILLLR